MVPALIAGLIPTAAKSSSALITHGAPVQTCRPLTSPRRMMRSAVILQTPMIAAFLADKRSSAPVTPHPAQRTFDFQ
jgi:hypothetical protein